MKFFVLLVFYFHVISAKLDTNWWKFASMYEILVPTFKDSNNDGIGDIKGITSKFDHFIDLGIDAIRLSPIFKNEFEIGKIYQITDHRSIDPRLGTMEDFDKLLRKSKVKDIKIIINIEISCTGEKHEWFLKSEERVPPYTDYYIWQDPAYIDKETGEPKPFDNIHNWKFSEKRKQFFYKTTAHNADLNLRNENVIKELQDIMKFWLNKGIAGFQLDSPLNYVKNFESIDSPQSKNLQESLKIVNGMRHFLNQYNKQNRNFERIFIVDGADPNFDHIPISYFGTETNPLYHLVYFDLSTSYLYDQLDGTNLNYLIYTLYTKVPEEETLAWQLEYRMIRELCLTNAVYSDILTMLESFLPGVALYHYGQEIALPFVTTQQTIIKRNKKFAKMQYILTPIMHWDESINAGFTKSFSPIFPPGVDYHTNNLKKQKAEENSHYNLFKKLLLLRKTETLKHGKLKTKIYSNNIFVLWRSLFGHPSYILCINTGDIEEEIDLSTFFKNLSKMFFVEMININYSYKKRHLIGGEDFKFILQPKSAIILSTENYLQ